MKYFSLISILLRHYFRTFLRIGGIKHCIKILLRIFGVKQDNASKLLKYNDIIEEELYLLSDEYEVSGGGMSTDPDVVERDIDIVSNSTDNCYYGSININGNFKWNDTNEYEVPTDLKCLMAKIEKSLI